MIIELFGPPGVGKTTLARALADRLRERGRKVELVLSYRPAEQRFRPERAARPRMPAALSRLIRPMVETVATARHSSDPGEACAAAEVMRLLKPRNVVQWFRLRQYLFRLARTWRRAGLAADIVLFDQAFVQAVYTLAQLARGAGTERIGLALDAVPAADLLVRLDAPRKILEARLAERRRHQGRIEQLLDAWTDLGSPGIFDQLHELLRARGRRVIGLETTDQHSLVSGVHELESLVLEAGGEVWAGSAAAQNRVGSWG